MPQGPLGRAPRNNKKNAQSHPGTTAGIDAEKVPREVGVERRSGMAQGVQAVDVDNLSPDPKPPEAWRNWKAHGSWQEGFALVWRRQRSGEARDWGCGMRHSHRCMVRQEGDKQEEAGHMLAEVREQWGLAVKCITQILVKRRDTIWGNVV